MNKTSAAVRTTVLRCLTDGMGVRATARTTGISKGAVLRILVEAGEFAAVYLDKAVRNVSVPRIECDEQWSFVGAHARRAKKEGEGDCWTFLCLASDSKLIVSWLVGDRSSKNTYSFIKDVAGRVVGRVQITTDGWAAYEGAIRTHFTWKRADYARVIKEYENDDTETQRRYGPSVVTGVSKAQVMGSPDLEKATTSYIENVNGQTRQKCKRFARLTSAHSKSATNHAHAVALNIFSHNFIRIHSTLTKEAGKKTTPAMAAGIATKPLTVDQLVEWMDPTAVTIK